MVVATGALLVALQLGLRAWQLFRSWFYADDYRLLDAATGSSFSLDYVLQPFDSQFMPFGRAIAWTVARSGHVDWVAAASLTLVVQALASSACLWMLVTLFGPRWGALAPLALYLTSALSMPGVMWWAASLNQLPLQAVLFTAVAVWVHYLRDPRPGPLALSLAIVGIEFLAYVKAVLVLGVMAFIVLAYFSTGGPRQRVTEAVRRYWLAALAAVVAGGAFVAYYLVEVPSVFAQPTVRVASDLADTMLLTSFPTGLVGGPWRWDASNPPAAVADPPGALVHVAWVVIALGVVGIALRRRRSLRAWVLLGAYLAVAYVLLLVSRAPITGGYGGLEYRYISDVAAVSVLCIGLATMPLTGAVESSEPRQRPLLLLQPPPLAVVVLTALLCGSGLVSSTQYSNVWADENPGADYVHTAIDGLHGQGELDLADQVVPATVMPPLSAPLNTTSRLLPLLADNVSFPTSTPTLVVLDDGGMPFRAVVEPTVESLAGDLPGCGWRVRSPIVSIPLDHRVFDFGWWIQVDYLASADDVMRVRVGDEEQEVGVTRGLNTVFLHVDSSFDAVDVGGLSPGTTVCVDTVTVGQPKPAGPL
ncbi:hypothetical protein [Nocardioides sp. T2.26MG-1]|uniref:hypothetical protein n=1 Tax=Nocardioides sp. T2.26MG-1 TaxID=3041166 RepID=UPI002477C414|nr:hypothetical protein [Nocardioides sp. T2.26MG-1]CAI9419918.1 hypothetical protein HIDPHFAB_03934 [Nocardioides sp. T2.26MG-1]